MCIRFPGDRGWTACCASRGKSGHQRAVCLVKMRDDRVKPIGWKVPQKIHRRWLRVSEAQVRLKWWSKSPPLLRWRRRHGKPHAMQDITEEGSLARSESSGNSRTLFYRAPLRWMRQMIAQFYKGRMDRIRLIGKRRYFLQNGIRTEVLFLVFFSVLRVSHVAVFW